ncbi:DUF6501 family protein [Sporosarcina sp. CAU 1771]
MTFADWVTSPTIRTVVCAHADAEKYVVNNMLTPGKEYEVKNETDEFIFVVDNSGKVGGYYKTYFN